MRQQPSFRPINVPGNLVRAVLLLVGYAGLGSAVLLAQDPPATDPKAQPAATQTTPTDKKPGDSPATPQTEVLTRDSATTFKVRVNLVLVRVVVRDEHDNIVSNLKKEDFQLFDNRKPQTISTFSVETPLSHVVPVITASDRDDGEPQPAPNLPQRFVSLLFDDLHLSMTDALTVRTAGEKILDALAPSDRVGVYTTSGQVTQEFTADRELLKRAMDKIIARPIAGDGYPDCPDISYYQANLIQNQNDTQALAVATSDALQCAYNGDQRMISAAATMARSKASQVLSIGDSSTEYAYSHLDAILRRLAGMPGQRKMVFISPGFLLSTLIAERSDAIDRATKAGIVIDTLDARALYSPDVNGDIGNPQHDSYNTAGFKSSYRVAAQFAQSEILADFANGTGGTYFHDRNDLEVGLRNSIAAPSTTYLLGFSPQNLKLNGGFHTLKVTLSGKQKYSVQARRGYYAPRTLKNPEENAKEEIQEAVFSQEEIRDLQVDLQTQFFRKDASQAHLSVLAHVDLKAIKFKKVEDRNDDDLTLATVIFDENGNFVAGGEKILEMKLRDATLERLDRSGITVKSSFDVKPGNYLVRLVVRDKEGEQMAARNGAVAIPY
jgi:VWFA-related protein